MRLLFILDPLDSLKTGKDTSLAIMREAARRGHPLFVAEQGDLLLRHQQVRILSWAFEFSRQPTSNCDSWFLLGEPEECVPAEFDAVLMRKDPPLTMNIFIVPICWNWRLTRARAS